jgi:hypothetical protein
MIYVQGLSKKKKHFVMDTYRVCTARSETFDEIMSIVQVHVGKHELLEMHY